MIEYLTLTSRTYETNDARVAFSKVQNKYAVALPEPTMRG